MKTLILLVLVIVVSWVLFRPFSQHELDRYKNRYKNNDWPDIEVQLILNKLIKKNNLNILKINSYSDDYAKTLTTWRENFLKNWDKIKPLGFDNYFKRMWEFYLCYCEGGFKSRNINLIQFSMSNKQSS